MDGCSKKGCCLPAVKNKCRNTSYCWKHWRFWTMRGIARRDKKYVPSWEELDQMLAFNIGRLCCYCGKKMTWHTSQGKRSDVMSLQHEGGESFSFICQSCNAAHGRKGDAFKHQKQIELQLSTYPG